MKSISIFLITFSIPLLFAVQALSLDQKVIVGIYQNEPIVFKDTQGQVKGFYVEIIEYIAKFQALR